MLPEEKSPDGPYEVAFAGVSVQSRYSKRHEMETMMLALDWVIDHAPSVASTIVELFCDSKACCSYTARCCHEHGPCSAEEVAAVRDLLDRALREVGGGHNGIMVDPGQYDPRVYADPWWEEDLS
jgi:hypothetical protein